MRLRAWAWMTVLIVVVAAAATRLRLLDVPLDRDEGEYGYFGQLLLHGVPPYAAAYNLKLPGIYGVYAAILAAFGQSPAAIHLGLLVVNAATTILVLRLAERVILLQAPPERVPRELFGLNPFPESVEIARYLRARTAEGDRIAVIGSEPQIYFYAGRRGATGHVYMYPLMEDQPYASGMQRQMIDEIETARPRFVVLVNASSSWSVRPQSDRTLFEWWERYQQNFDRVGFIDIMSDQLTTYVWDAAAASATPKSLVCVAVFERRSP